MAVKTPIKAAQDRELRERKAAAASDTESGAALPGGVTVKRGGKSVPKAEQKSEGKALTMTEAEKKERAAARASTDIREVEEIPKSERQANRAAAKTVDVWAERLKKVAESNTGKALIYSTSSDSKYAANAAAYSLRKKLKEGKFNEALGEDAAERFRIMTHGTDIYAEHVRAA